MGRNLKIGLDYFNVDCNPEDNLNYIEAKFGIIGYAIVIKLWRKIYMINGYYTEWNDKNVFLFARDIGSEVDLINQVVKLCLDEKIFDREMFEKHGILTSHGIQKRYLKVVTDAKRKDTSIIEEYSLLPKTPEEKKKTPEETEKTPEESTQIKSNEITSNQKESNEIKSGKSEKKQEAEKEPASDVPVDSVESTPDLQAVYKGLKKDKISIAAFIREHKPQFITPYYDLWNLFAEEKKIPKVTKLTKSRVQKFNIRIKEKPFDFLQILKKAGQSQFLLEGQWFGFDWLVKNEVNYLKVIEGNYDSKGPLKPGEVKITRDVEYLFDRFKEGNLDSAFITQDHYLELEKAGLARIDESIIQKRMKSLFGSRIMSETDLYNDYAAGTESKRTVEDRPNLMKLAVIEYFKKRKTQCSTAQN